MMYQEKSFTVPASAGKPKDCQHGWVNEKRGACVLCGEKVQFMALPQRPEGWYDPTVPFVATTLNRRDL
jgi:hypothetical protein